MDNEPIGFLSDKDIGKLLDKDIVICNYDERNLTDIGYNLTSTEFVFSINKGLLVPVHNRDNKRYCLIEPNDTVLIITREAIWVSEKISGTFHSKVKVVSQGFGHISTTLDAFWEGPLLISLNNPTKKKLEFIIGEDKGNGFRYSSFVTLVFYKMATPTEKGHDNLPSRMDILKDIVKEPWLCFFHYKYRSLERVIEIIRNMESLVVGIGKVKGEERDKRIEIFKKKYERFADQIEFHIQQAHTINEEILRLECYGMYFMNFIAFLPILALVYWGYITSTSNNPSLLSLILALFSAYVSFYIFFLKKKGD